MTSKAAAVAMRRDGWVWAAILVGTALAGCVDGPTAQSDSGAPADPAAYQDFDLVPLDALRYVDHDPLAAHSDATHDHSDPAQHEGSHNMELVKYVPGEDGQGFTEIDIVGDFAYQCAGSGFRIVDITNRADPVIVSIYSGTQYCADIKVTADGTLATVMGREWVDVSDKEDPQQVLADSGGYGHMAYVKTIGGQDYVFLARDASHEIPFGSGIGIYRLDRDPVSLEHEADFIVPVQNRVNSHMPDGDVFAHQVHDMTVYDDDALGKTVMLAAYWDLGVRVVDVTNPANPTEIGAWDDFRGDLGDIHTVGVDFIDGRRIIAAATENGAIIDPVGSASGYSAGFVYLLDATDLDEIVLVGKWINPGKHASGAQTVGVYSMHHNIQFVQGRVYVAHYHAGVWIIDAAGYVADAIASPVRTATREDNVPSWGYYMTTSDDAAPDVWDVAVKDGFIYASDIGNGLHVVRFLGDPPGDVAFTSFA